MVHSIIQRHFHSQIKNDPHFYEDLVSEGKLAIVKSIQKHDPKKGKFSTYCYRAIKNELIDLSNRNNRKSFPVSLTSQNVSKESIEKFSEGYSKLTPAERKWAFREPKTKKEKAAYNGAKKKMKKLISLS